jgi:hypothetical protein
MRLPQPAQSPQGDVLFQGRVDDHGQLEVTFRDGDQNRIRTMPVGWMLEFLEFLKAERVSNQSSGQDSLNMAFNCRSSR